MCKRDGVGEGMGEGESGLGWGRDVVGESMYACVCVCSSQGPFLLTYIVFYFRLFSPLRV